MECRGVVGAYDGRADSMTIWSSTQVVHWVRREAAAVLRLPEARIRCVALDVGGGFGIKGHVYPEDLLIPFLARAVGRPVRWIEDRQRAFHVGLPFARPDRTTSRSASTTRAGSSPSATSFIVDCGAWNPIGAGIAYNTAVHLLGPYKFDQFRGAGAHRHDQQGAECALSRRRTPGGGVRDGAHDGPDRGRARARAGRGAACAT